MDIKGAEYEVLPCVMTYYAEAQQIAPVTQAQIDYHHQAGRPSTKPLLSTLWLVEEGGFRACLTLNSTTMERHGTSLSVHT